MTKNDLAERVRSALVETVVRAYDDAGIQGLCAEGRWEAAVSALRSADLAALLREFPDLSASKPKPPNE